MDAYDTFNTAKAILKSKGVKECAEFLTNNNAYAKAALYAGISLATGQLDDGIKAAILEKLIDTAIQNILDYYERQVNRIINELTEDLAVKGLIQKKVPSSRTSSETSRNSNRNSYGGGGNSGNSGYGGGGGYNPPGGHTGAIHDPQGIVYEAVLSNPVEGATVTLHDETDTLWDASDYGQENPIVTGYDGGYQWFVPEGEWKVYASHPEGSVLSDNTSSDHPAANKDDGSKGGWLPVLPVQMGINIPLKSSTAPTVESVHLYGDKLTADFSLYMDVSTLIKDAVKAVSGSSEAACSISFPDMEEDPYADGKYYAKRMELSPVSGSFSGSGKYVLKISKIAKAYNGLTLTDDFESKALSMEPSPSMKLSESVLNMDMGANSEKTITVKVVDGDGKALQGIAVNARNSSPLVASLSHSADTDANGEAAFTVTAESEGMADIAFETEAGLSQALTVNVGTKYTYKSHTVTWDDFDYDNGFVTAEFHVEYAVNHDESGTVSEDALSSGKLRAAAGQVSGNQCYYSVSFATRDGKTLTEGKYFPMNGSDKPDDPENPNNPDNPDNPNNPDEPGPTPSQNSASENSASGNAAPTTETKDIGNGYTLTYPLTIIYSGKKQKKTEFMKTITVSQNGETKPIKNITMKKGKDVSTGILITKIKLQDKNTIRDLSVIVPINPFEVTADKISNVKQKKDGTIKTLKVKTSAPKPAKAKTGKDFTLSSNGLDLVFQGNYKGSVSVNLLKP